MKFDENQRRVEAYIETLNQIMTDVAAGSNVPETNSVPTPNAGANNLNNNINNNNRPRPVDPLISVRDRLFHTLFIKTALAYAQAFPKPARRIIELCFLLTALGAFFILIYIHITFSQTPATCLEHVKESWPRDGILRVEILRQLPNEKLVEVDVNESHLTLLRNKNNGRLVSIDPSKPLPNEQGDEHHGEIDHTQQLQATASLNDANSEILPTEFSQNHSDRVVIETTTNLLKHESDCSIGSKDESHEVDEIDRSESEGTHAIDNDRKETLIYPNETYDKVQSNDESEESETEKRSTAEWQEEEYIVEYSLEYGFLRLSSSTRKKLNIPVQTVLLDPQKDSCFGDPLSRFILRQFLGYDDLLMASVKVLAEQEDNKGFLRNVVTGEHYRFVSMWWFSRGSYPAAFFIMILFTVSISMLLRYSHHQIFVFIGEY
ncbi:Membralin [Pseudolycoriella hygida]|uniref:Membralin n=1 Tax=Pseudolycoriella hygida TaxID=35572 RepID=A0A9Q0MR13_9DIPT|nr:Membralin [Pseudolycoriella hygida]